MLNTMHIVVLCRHEYVAKEQRLCLSYRVEDGLINIM